MSNQSEKMLFLMELSVLQSKLDKRLSLALSIHGVSLSEFMVLHQLANAPGHCLSRVVLASAVHLTASGVTRLLNPLEKLHIVEKQKNSRDARISLVHLTEAGLETYVNAKQTYSETADSLLHDIDINELSEMLKSIQVAV